MNHPDYHNHPGHEAHNPTLDDNFRAPTPAEILACPEPGEVLAQSVLKAAIRSSKDQTGVHAYLTSELRDAYTLLANLGHPLARDFLCRTYASVTAKS